MSNALKIAGALNSSTSTQTYVDDVFSTYLYTGNGATQTINNGIDLAGNGGLVWLKGRSGATDHALYDTARGATFDLVSNSTAAQTTQATGLTSFGSTGFSIGALAKLNTNNATYSSWTFRKAPKFFDVVTYTGNGTTQTINHSLGQTPGMIIVKRTDTTGQWPVYHRSLTSSSYHLLLNTTDAQALNTGWWNGVDPTSTTFTVGNNAGINASGGTYVAYLFAHDTAADGIIQCGSFTTNASGGATVTLGWEPQLVLRKCSSTTSDWVTQDVMRGWVMSGTDYYLNPNLAAAESGSTGGGNPTATGFVVTGLNLSETYIYLAIRRPNKPPTSGTQVFTPVAYTGTGANNTVSAGFTTDTVFEGNRTKSTAGSKFGTWDRMRGVNYLITNTTAAEVAATTTIIQANPWDSMTGLKVGTTSTLTNTSADTFAYWMFKRAPGFMDVVCYTGTGVAGTVSHNLGVAPELMIVKSRSNALVWPVYHSGIGNNGYAVLNGTNAAITPDSTAWNNTSPTASSFSIGTYTAVNTSAATYVAYLFATLPGISKVGSYTGNGTSQTINCGFSTGARFVLIKRTDSTGDWFVWDTARGIVAANDPHLSLNTTAAEVTTDDSIDPDTSGFIVNQVAATNVNVSSATYIYLAIA